MTTSPRSATRTSVDPPLSTVRAPSCAPATMAYIAGVMAACAGMGWVMARWLGSSPAVVSLQLIRLICVILFGGWLPRILARR